MIIEQLTRILVHGPIENIINEIGPYPGNRRENPQLNSSCSEPQPIV